ncbi:dil and ankyrin domain containing protein [Grosmannia clavigera kw1407]|uniref:Dil and ankyrin domain containing protein n=1 Tax=Grosmannia clavigera (strain kw1407 / UAMH 11150) TaxID=655863 RepID=F0XTI6_GROCL|nr:dil and ankyrin domain containing protein [Grosmannia clavigera kw1407]EFW98578.1 dil and ankyrin domain containing protein [Grosmannia clavigera kw1407]
MDPGNVDADILGPGGGFGSPSRGDDAETKGGRALPEDLPKSLYDRRQPLANLVPETEYYDGWQGQSQFLTSPILAKPLGFGELTLNDPDYGEDVTKSATADSDTRLMEMLAAQAAHASGGAVEDEEAVANSISLSDEEKRATLQRALNMAASNGNVEQVRRLLKGRTRRFMDVNAEDEDGTPPLIYASCFGHEAVVQALIEAGADVDRQDRNAWSALMWAMTNRHKGIAKLLLDNGASTEAKTSSGRTAFDFVAPDSEMSYYLHDSGYNIGNAGVTDDFYNPGFSQDRFEEEMAENEMRRRMMMESARDLEVDLGNVGIDDQPEAMDEFEEQPEFDWTRCLNDQMFVFQESDLDRILDIVISNMTPQRSPSQKPVPANVVFLSARYAHYHASADLLEKLLVSAMDKINDVVERHQWDMTILAFWISNVTLLLHYLKKDAGLLSATTDFQAQLAELINEIFVLIVRDAERRLDKVLDPAMLEHETIPGFEDIAFQHEWKLFRRKKEVKEEPLERRFRPPSPKQRAKPAPRNVTSLLSSTLFVLDLYDVHSVITGQCIAQLLYWLGAELFNRIMCNRKYLARTKAMQIRMNISILEDWARANNRVPGHYEHGELRASGEPTVEAARRHLEPVIQLLQWLQCFSSLAADDLEALVGTLQQLRALSPQQLIHAAEHYRSEVGEKGLPKSALRYLLAVQKEAALRREQREQRNRRKTMSPGGKEVLAAAKSLKDKKAALPQIQLPQSVPATPISQVFPGDDDDDDDESDAPTHLLLDPALMLPFTLPSATDMLVSYGAGFGGVNRERAHKYVPTLPPEFLARLESSGSSSTSRPMFGEQDWENEEV